jgi:exosortase
MVLFREPLLALFHKAMSSDDASHILLVPLIVAWLLYLDRKKIHPTSFALPTAFFFAVSAVVLGGIVTYRPPADASLTLAALVSAFVLLLVSGFIGIFGRRSARLARFPLAFLGFLVPLPDSFLDRAIYLLQAGSAAVAEWIFDLSGIPALREGFIFRLPTVSIEVAKECSGIRSSLALLILALLIAHFSFRSLWKKAAFVGAGLLMMMIKNGVRIATLTILASKVDPGFLFGRLHHQGGIVFFLIGLALMLPVYWLLRRGENRSPARLSTQPTLN